MFLYPEYLIKWLTSPFFVVKVIVKFIREEILYNKIKLRRNVKKKETFPAHRK
jgi:hypothetical protein